MDAAELDEWRALEADRIVKAQHPHHRPRDGHKFAEYRRLVREGIEPPAEPDQDVLDTRAVLEAWHTEMDSRDWEYLMGTACTGQDDFAAAKQIVKEIKDRVRREEREAANAGQAEWRWSAPKIGVGGSACSGVGGQLWNDGTATRTTCDEINGDGA